MPTSKLGLYNEALFLLGERKLTDLTEDREPRRVLDSVYDADAIRTVLEMGQWDFATRTVEIEYSASIDPEFGYQYAFEKPTDLVRLTALCNEPYFSVPFVNYRDERGYWWADDQTLYASYVSDDEEYGGDLSLWPASFARMFALYLAVKACPRIPASESKLERLQKDFKKQRLEAESRDAQGGPAKFAPQGSWASARHGRWIGRRTRENG